MRTIPGMVVINPADAVEARAAVYAAINYNGPVYLRFGRLAVPVINDEETFNFEIGKGQTVREGSDVTIISTGICTAEAIKAADELEKEGISAAIVNIHTIKPIDKEIIKAAAEKTGCIVTAEEHSIIGGLGSAVCEVLAEECPVPVLRVGVNDCFGKSGKAADLIDEFGLSARFIVEKVKKALTLKK